MSDKIVKSSTLNTYTISIIDPLRKSSLISPLSTTVSSPTLRTFTPLDVDQLNVDIAQDNISSVPSSLPPNSSLIPSLSFSIPTPKFKMPPPLLLTLSLTLPPSLTLNISPLSISPQLSPRSPYNENNIYLTTPKILDSELILDESGDTAILIMSLDPYKSLFYENNNSNKIDESNEITNKKINLYFYFHDKFSIWYFNFEYSLEILFVLWGCLLVLLIANEPLSYVSFSILVFVFIALFKTTLHLIESSILFERTVLTFDFAYMMLLNILFISSTLIQEYQNSNSTMYYLRFTFEYSYYFIWFLLMIIGDCFPQISRKYKLLFFFLYIVNSIRIWYIDTVRIVNGDLSPFLTCINSSSLESCLSLQSIKISATFAMCLFVIRHSFVHFLCIWNDTNAVFTIISSTVRILNYQPKTSSKSKQRAFSHSKNKSISLSICRKNSTEIDKTAFLSSKRNSNELQQRKSSIYDFSEAELAQVKTRDRGNSTINLATPKRKYSLSAKNELSMANSFVQNVVETDEEISLSLSSQFYEDYQDFVHPFNMQPIFGFSIPTQYKFIYTLILCASMLTTVILYAINITNWIEMCAFFVSAFVSIYLIISYYDRRILTLLFYHFEFSYLVFVVLIYFVVDSATCIYNVNSYAEYFNISYSLNLVYQLAITFSWCLIVFLMFSFDAFRSGKVIKLIYSTLILFISCYVLYKAIFVYPTLVLSSNELVIKPIIIYIGNEIVNGNTIRINCLITFLIFSMKIIMRLLVLNPNASLLIRSRVSYSLS